MVQSTITSSIATTISPVPIAWAFYFAAGMWRDEIENPLVDESNPKLVDSAAVR